MRARVWINEIEFWNGKKILLEENDVVVFVGPNNAGKSASLKELASLLAINNRSGKIIRSLNYSKQGNQNDLVSYIAQFSQEEHIGNPLPQFKGFKFNIYQGNAMAWWQEGHNGISQLTQLFTNSLGTEQRLQAANPAQSIRLNKEAPTNPIHFLQKSDELEKNFNSYFKQAFGLDLIVHRNAGREVPLYIGIAPVPQVGQDRLSEAYQNSLEKLDLLHEQGDGMRSFVGVLLNAFVSHHSILFIDEPEAFLHPPQARLLGKMLVKDLPSERQLFLATHSIDFLKGLLDSGGKNLKIVRIQRNGKTNDVSILNNDEINTIWSDSLLRHSNVLDGLFHSQVIICESDSDNRFYSAVLSAVYEEKQVLSPDTLFLHCGGKHRIPVVIKALRQLNVVVKVITDFDVLNDVNPIKEIFEELGGDWTEIEKDWKMVKSAIDAKRPELETKDLKDEIETIFDSVQDRIIPKEQLILIQKLLKKASAWSHAKETGKAFIPSGDATQAYERIQIYFKKKGFFIVEVDQLESFARSVGNHGPKWVNLVLEKDLIKDHELSLAREFILEVSDS